MRCEQAQASISASIDGEGDDLDDELVNDHLRHCSNCREFKAMDEGWNRAGIVGTAPEMPDLSRRVRQVVARQDRSESWGIARWTLVVVALQIIAFAVTDLTTTDESGVAAHDARHLGAFSMAYGIALLVVVARPARARTILPVAGVLALAMMITAIVDLASGRIPLAGEVLHLPEVLSVGLVWAIAVPTGRRASTRAASRGPRLALVRDGDERLQRTENDGPTNCEG